MDSLYLLVNADGALHYHSIDPAPDADNSERIVSLKKLHGYTDQDAWFIRMTMAISERPMIVEIKYVTLSDYQQRKRVRKPQHVHD